METEQPEWSQGSSPFPADVPSPSKGGFWIRAVAYILDLTLLQLIYTFFLVVGTAAIDLALSGSISFNWGNTSSLIFAESSVWLWTALFILYFTFFNYWGGQTPGKMLLHLRVVTQELEELPLLRALARTLSYFLSSFFVGVGFLITAFHREKRALHDFIARTYVVKV